MHIGEQECAGHGGIGCEDRIDATNAGGAERGPQFSIGQSLS